MRSALRRPMWVALVLAVLSWAAPSEAQQGDLAEARARAESAAARFTEAEEALEALDEQVEALSGDVAAANSEAAELVGSMRSLVVDEYITLGLGVSVSLDPIEQARAESILKVVRRDREDELEAYRVARDRRIDLTTELDERLAEQQETLAQLENSRNELFAELERLEVLERERREAERRAEAARAAAAAARQSGRSSSGIVEATTAGSRSGVVVCPVAGAHTFIDSWGFARSGGRRHKGVDMMAANGTPIVAPVAGVVSHGSNRLGGNSFHLNGDDGHYYYGTHLSAYGASGRVSAGTVIGYVGDTGNARGGAPHLHFEFHPNHGSAVNPYPLVRPVC